MKLNDIHNIDEAMMAGGQEAYATEGHTVYDMDKEYGAPAQKHKPMASSGKSVKHDPDAPDPMHRDQRRFQADQDRYLKAQRDAIAKMKAEKGLEEALAMGMEEEFIGEPHHDGSTFKNSLHTIHRVAVYLNKNISDDDDIPEWVAEKMGAAKGMLTSVMQYLISEKEMHRGEADIYEQGVAEGGYQGHFKSKEEAVSYAKEKVKTFRDPEDGIEVWAMPGGGFDVVATMNSNGRNHAIQQGGKKLGTIGARYEGMAESSPETSLHLLQGLKTWQVVIMNNYYRGKYSDYSGRYYYVLAHSPEEAKQVVLDNADGILQDLLSMKSHNGKKILPRGSAVRITPDRIGKIEDGTVAGRMSTAGFKKMFSPQGPLMVKLSDGAIVDVQGQEQGVAEGNYDIKKDPVYKKYSSETHTMMYKDGKHKAVKHSQVAAAKAAGWKVRNSLNAFIKGQQGVAEAPDYAAMYESKLVEFAGGMGAGSVATAPGVGKGSNVGSLFGGSYSQKNSPFKKTKAKKESVIKR